LKQPGNRTAALKCANARLPRELKKASLKDMSRQTIQLLEAFEGLPEEEKRIFTVEFLRRAIPFDSGPLDDDETARSADEAFALLNTEEENDTAPR